MQMFGCIRRHMAGLRMADWCNAAQPCCHIPQSPQTPAPALVSHPSIALPPSAASQVAWAHEHAPQRAEDLVVIHKKEARALTTPFPAAVPFIVCGAGRGCRSAIVIAMGLHVHTLLHNMMGAVLACGCGMAVHGSG